MILTLQSVHACCWQGEACFAEAASTSWERCAQFSWRQWLLNSSQAYKSENRWNTSLDVPSHYAVLAIAPIIMTALTALRFVYGRNVCKSGFRVAMNCHKIRILNSPSGWCLILEMLQGIICWVAEWFQPWIWKLPLWILCEMPICMILTWTTMDNPARVKYCLVGLDSSCCNPRTCPRGSSTK